MYKVKNIYTNQQERNSVSFEIRKCNNQTNPNCKPETEVEDLFSEIFFTEFHIETKADFSLFE